MNESSLKADLLRRDDRADRIAAPAAMDRLMVENTIDLIIRYDASLRRIYVSPSSRELFGYEPAEMLRSNAAAMIHPDDFGKVDPLFRQVGPARPSLQLTFRVLRKDNIYIWVEGQYRYLSVDGGSVAVLRDITAQKQAEDLLADTNEKLEIANRVLQAMAHRDGLTGLLNRRRFDELVEEVFAQAQRSGLPLTILLLDVDFFKAYNDRYGHPAGDECLRRISRAIESALRRPGDVAARFGGEEFVVVLPATDHAGALDAAERICSAASAMKIEHLGSALGIVTVSVGGSSVLPAQGGTTSADLINAADCALYRSKSEGRNRITAVELHDGLPPASASESSAPHEQPRLVLGLS